MECYSCESSIGSGQAYRGDKGTSYEGKPLCETCYYEDEPCATVFYGSDKTPYVISGTRNETNGDFYAKWHSTDPWRGYYETKSDSYSLVNTAELLAWHESEEMLAKFDGRVRELFDEHDVEYARVFARSSNLFYQNYDLYVRKGQELPAHLLVAKTKDEVNYGDPKWYRNIVFDAEALGTLKKLFPESGIETDYDAVGLIEKYGDGIVPELQRRLKGPPR